MKPAHRAVEMALYNTHTNTLSLTPTLTHSHTIMHTHTHSHSHSHTHPHTHSHTLAYTHTITHSHTHCHTLTLTHSLTRILTHSHSHTYTSTHSHSFLHAHSHTHTLTHTYTLSYTHTFTHILTLTHSLSHSITHTFTHARLVFVFSFNRPFPSIEMQSACRLSSFTTFLFHSRPGQERIAFGTATEGKLNLRPANDSALIDVQSWPRQEKIVVWGKYGEIIQNININTELRLPAGSGCDELVASNVIFRWNEKWRLCVVYCRMIHQLIGWCGKKIKIGHYGGTNTRCFVTLFTEETSPNTDISSNMPRKHFRTVDNGWYSRWGLEDVCVCVCA